MRSYDPSYESAYVMGVTLFAVTDKAIRVGFKDETAYWIPTSQIRSTDIDYLSEDGDLYQKGYVEIPRWLADKLAIDWC